MLKSSESSKGLSVIKKVMNELDDLLRKTDLNLFDNTIINVTELIKAEYAKDITQFKMITSLISFIVTDIDISNDNIEYDLIILSDSKVGGLEKINLTDMVGLLDIDLVDYKYLSNCTFHLNRLYNVDQFNMIPGIRYTHEIIKTN